MGLRLAIASPSQAAYSETFVAMQMARLPCVLRIHGQSVTGETIPGGPLRPSLTVTGLWGLLGRGSRSVGIRASLRQSELARRLRRGRVNRILANFGPTGVSLLPLARALGLPLVVHFHGYDAHQRNVVRRHAEDYRDLGRHAAAFIAVSMGMIDQLCALGMPREKLHLVRCGVDPARFSARERLPESPVFFGVGRFVDKKAPYLTLLAFAEARKRLPAARLVLGGTGELLETTRNLALALRIASWVDFPGVLSQEQIAEQMRNTTAFVQHSIEPKYGWAEGDREGTPVAMLEAMMSGLPVISTRHAGIGEVVAHDQEGLLVAERDVQAMAEAMVAVGSLPTLCQRLGDAARSKALAHHAADSYVAALVRILTMVGGCTS